MTKYLYYITSWLAAFNKVKTLKLILIGKGTEQVLEMHLDIEMGFFEEFPQLQHHIGGEIFLVSVIFNKSRFFSPPKFS